MKKLYKLPPCSIYDVPAIETWLFDLAQDGLLLQKTYRCLFVFEDQKQPPACKYRLEPIPDGSRTPAADMLDDYACAGWEYTAALDRSFFIWRSIRPDADELHSDPLVQSTAYSRLCRRMAKNAAAAALLPVVIFAIFLCGMMLTDKPVTLFLAGPSITLLIAAETIAAIQAVRQLLTLRRLKQSLAYGLSAIHSKDYKKGLRLRRFAQACSSILLLLILSMPVFIFTLNWEKSLSEVNTPLPYLPLELIEPGTGRQASPFDSAAYSWTLFVPVHYYIYEQGSSPRSIDYDPASGAVTVNPSVRTEYFQLSLPFLAVPLYKEHLRHYIRRSDSPVVTTYSHPDFDFVTTARSSGYTQLFACRGNQVIHIQYWGPAELSGLLNELSAAFHAVKNRSRL